MGDFEVVPASAHRRARWANNGGWTSEIVARPFAARSPEPRSPEPGVPTEWAWRLSVADVDTPGQFSIFENVDRTISLLRGNGFCLTHDHGLGTVIDVQFVPYEFDGGVITHCALVDGPVQDLNLMVHRANEPMSLRFVTLTAERATSLVDVDALVVVDGHAVFADQNLGYLDAVVASQTATMLEVKSRARTAVVAVVSRDR